MIDCVLWLEFWYNLLKDNSLKYEFKGRLLEWFYNNNGWFIEPQVYDDESFEIIVWVNRTNNNCEEIYSEIPISAKTYKEVEHQGILEVFKLLKTTK